MICIPINTMPPLEEIRTKIYTVKLLNPTRDRLLARRQSRWKNNRGIAYITLMVYAEPFGARYHPG